MLDLIVGGILRGGIYVLIAMGLSLVFGVMKIPNFAHGEFYLVGAYTAYFGISSFKMNPIAAILAAAAVGFIVGALIEKITFYPLRKRSKADWVLNTFMVTAGLSFIIQNLAQVLFGANFRGINEMWGGSIRIAGLNVSADRLIAFGIAMVTLVLVWLFLKKSKIGNAILAVSEHETGALLMGVKLDMVHTLTFALSSMLAAIAGAALLSITPAYPTMGMQPLYAAWFVVILVGLGNIESTVIGGFMVGMIEVFAIYFFGAAWQNAAALSVIVLVLIFKPSGLFGKALKV